MATRRTRAQHVEAGSQDGQSSITGGEEHATRAGDAQRLVFTTRGNPSRAALFTPLSPTARQAETFSPRGSPRGNHVNCSFSSDVKKIWGCSKVPFSSAPPSSSSSSKRQRNVHFFQHL